MQALVSAIRATGAHQPILLGGLNYANDLTGWLSHEPTDPARPARRLVPQLPGPDAATTSPAGTRRSHPSPRRCRSSAGEFDQNVGAPSTFDVDYMNWADLHGVSYLAWGWWVLSPQEIADAGASAYYLHHRLRTARRPRRTASNLHDHLAALCRSGRQRHDADDLDAHADTDDQHAETVTEGSGPRAEGVQRPAEGRRQRGGLRDQGQSQDSSGTISARTVGTVPAEGRQAPAARDPRSRDTSS